MMRTLEAFIAKLGGGALAPGWRCAVKVRPGCTKHHEPWLITSEKGLS